MSSLREKSLHQLRGIAQSYGIGDIFSKDAKQLAQAIEFHQQELIPDVVIDIPKPEYDARLMTKPPSRRSDEESIRELLAQHVDQGLHLSFDHERWYMKFGKKTDEGTVRMPLRTVLSCANAVMK